MTHFTPINETIRLNVTDKVTPELKSALITFCRRNGFIHVFFEIIEPLLSSNNLILALAITDRPWPPKGIGSQTVEAIGIALIGNEDRGLLTPVLVDRKHSTNLGLVSAITKQLIESLRNKKVALVSYLIRQGDRVLERALEQAGFARSDLQAATEFAEYVEFSTTPETVLNNLELENVRLGDLLALNISGRSLDRISQYHYALTAGISPFLSDSIRYAALLPGLLDLIATLPPGGVPPGTRGPSGFPEEISPIER